jgi:hypothetical protein
VRTATSLTIAGPTIIASTGPATRVTDACVAADEVTIEAWVRSANLAQDGPARIATLSSDLDNRNLSLAQRAGEYAIPIRTTTTNLDGDPAAQTQNNGVTPLPQHVLFAFSGGNLAGFIDGQGIGVAPIGGDLSGWDRNFSFALGNELTGNRPWVGELLRVAMYCRALSAAEAAQNFAAGP